MPEPKKEAPPPPDDWKGAVDYMRKFLKLTEEDIRILLDAD